MSNNHSAVWTLIWSHFEKLKVALVHIVAQTAKRLSELGHEQDEFNIRVSRLECKIKALTKVITELQSDLEQSKAPPSLGPIPSIRLSELNLPEVKIQVHHSCPEDSAGTSSITSNPHKQRSLTSLYLEKTYLR